MMAKLMTSARIATGPIVRISPYELHINDFEYFDEIYSASSRLDKYGWFYRWVNSPLSVVSTVGHDLHKSRRRAMSPFFSDSSVARLEPTLHQVVKKLCSVFEKHRANGQPLDLSSLYRCLAIDVITEYCFPKSYGFLDYEDLPRGFFQSMRNFSQVSLWHRHFPFIFQLFQLIPRRVLGFIDRQSLSAADFQKVCS